MLYIETKKSCSPLPKPNQTLTTTREKLKKKKDNNNKPKHEDVSKCAFLCCGALNTAVAAAWPSVPTWTAQSGRSENVTGVTPSCWTLAGGGRYTNSNRSVKGQTQTGAVCVPTGVFRALHCPRSCLDYWLEFNTYSFWGIKGRPKCLALPIKGYLKRFARLALFKKKKR